MKVSEGIKLLFKRTGAKQGEVATKMGYASPTIISNAMARENLTVDLLIRICNELNYEVVIRPNTASKGSSEIIFDSAKKEGVSK
jgi:transcriptional regulator with XRE-family HTH domain